MADVVCVNEDCDEQGIPKDAAGFDPALIVCGACAQPVEPVGADDEEGV